MTAWRRVVAATCGLVACLAVLPGCVPSAGAPDPSGTTAGLRSPSSGVVAGSTAAGRDRDDRARGGEAARLEPCPASSDAAVRPDGLPDLTLPCLGGGRAVRLAGLRGTPTVLNVWAQWCGPCREEAPHFQALHERAGSRLRVVGVDYDDRPAARALAFAAELGLRYPQLADPDKRLRGPFRLLSGIPATAFVAADGRVVRVAHKPYRSAAELAADVRRYLRVTP